ncbi:MAG: hypothetical protein RR983_19970 [Massilia sp.]|jgi:hypothetical protein|uniref:hypothetical protein n=1 Tax=Massilia sp. TaxID=1882437 RepID=UPI0019BA8B1B|nr:hypothetical protein [Oxalobacteraceae sp. CFBP 8761]MBD8629179.1 hypothetical protein [Oxalobacteraceae sp. CFBP 8753]MBD8633473.1 hypothetical protein [Oxalobacteraceae sp. CFBP 8755]
MAPFYKNSTWTASVTITALRYHARFKMTGNTMKNTFATLPIAALWVFAALLGLPALYDGANALRSGRAVDVFVQIGPLMMALFLAWCALQRRAGRLALLTSPRVTLIGFICFGAFAGCFLIKLVLRNTTLFA